MITNSERNILDGLMEDQTDVVVLINIIMLSRYDRISKEAAQFDKVLGPVDFLALAREAQDDVNDWFNED